MTEKTHMRREIEEIPEAAARLLEASGGDIAAAGRQLGETRPRFLATAARGSSDHAAAFMKYAVEISAGVPVASLGPSIASIYGAKLQLQGSACIAISQSGGSPDIVALCRAAKEGGALQIAITNAPGSPLAGNSDHTIDIMAGPELSVAATKSFVNSALAGLLLLAHWRSDGRLLAALRALPARLEEAIACDWMELGGSLPPDGSLFILGRGPSQAIANEAALKFKETCAMHAESYSAAEVMHGPLALVRQHFPVLALAARDASEQSVAAAADDLASRGATAFVTSRHASRARRLPYTETGHPLTDPLPLVVSFYAFVEAFARMRGLDPDRPPNLRKVTETL